MSKVLVIGKSGQLAQELVKMCSTPFEVIALGRNEIDITNSQAISDALALHKAEAVINASAYTAVDKAEEDQEAAFALNESAVKNLATACKRQNTRFIHVSTDFVFDGNENRAYMPNSKTNPKGIYGASKLAGEKAVLSTYPENSIIVRTSWVYSTFANNFVKTMLKLMASRDSLGVVADQIGCPTYAKDLASFLLMLVNQTGPDSIYHWSDNGVASWYDFAVAIHDIALNEGLLTKPIAIEPIGTEDYPTPATRPAFSLLNQKSSQPIKKAKHWTENLQHCIKELKADSLK